ncbi:trafficking kinesin-binding protein 1-like [Xenopus tropicalis]|uniref:Trafficking kinesin-binding protein 1-like n=1 Tax=Xenopus tropicalis TaxID=8364 RepID=A0A8J1JQY1_XENTR|nr:trafficking kinesin-binding protein 1-like [Xenopus tropicalis]
MEMLHEAQEELRNLRNKTMPNVISRRYHTLGVFPLDSLAAEIEGSMRKELQMDEPDSPEMNGNHHKRVFETVKNVNQVVKQRSLAPSPMNIPGSNQSSAMNSLMSSCVSTPRSSLYGGDVSNIVIDNKTNSIILESESSENRSLSTVHICYFEISFIFLCGIQYNIYVFLGYSLYLNTVI